MGNNSAFTAFEHAVVNTYKHAPLALNKKLLSAFMEPYRDTDIDSGGKMGLFVKEGGNVMEVEDIVIKVMTGKFIEPPKLPKAWQNWTPEQNNANEAYHEKRDGAFNKITDRFGWR